MRTKSHLKISLLRTIQILLLGVCVTELVSAQTWDRKDLEVSLSGSLYDFTSGDLNAFFITPRLGYFVITGLEVEPELMFMFTPGSHPVYILNSDVSYNFNTNKKGVPFVLVGYGIANRYPIIKKDFAVGVLNVGVGVKFFLEEGPTVRLEYRYQKFSLSSSRDEVRIHTVHLGFVILSQ
jgi:hypothetical protein